MPSHPTRYYGTRHLHFINCSCYHRQPWLARPPRRDLFLRVLEHGETPGTSMISKSQEETEVSFRLEE